MKIPLYVAEDSVDECEISQSHSPYSISYEHLYFDDLLHYKPTVAASQNFDFNRTLRIDLHNAICRYKESKGNVPIHALSHIGLLKYMRQEFINARHFAEDIGDGRCEVTLFGEGIRGKTSVVKHELNMMQRFFEKRLTYLDRLPDVDFATMPKEKLLLLDFLQNSQSFIIPTFYDQLYDWGEYFFDLKYDLVSRLLLEDFKVDYQQMLLEDAVGSIYVVYNRPLVKGRKCIEIFLPNNEFISYIKAAFPAEDISDFLRDDYQCKHKISFSSEHISRIQQWACGNCKQKIKE